MFSYTNKWIFFSQITRCVGEMGIKTLCGIVFKINKVHNGCRPIGMEDTTNVSL